MKTVSHAALAALVSLVAATPASAEQSRWYVSGNLGFGDLASTTLAYSDTNVSASASTGFDVSFAGGATVGYLLSNRFSIEGELKYRRNEFGPVDLGSFGTFSGGDFASLGLGVNALYRFTIGNSGKLSGYVGPGYVYVQEIDIDFDNAGEQEISFESDESGFQLKLGGRYDVSDRWFVEASAAFLAGGSVTMTLPSDSSRSLTADYDHWTGSIGAGIRF